MYNLQLLSYVAANLNHFEQDCAITVALKIIDDTCKMDEYEKSLFLAIYDALPKQTSEFFEESVFDIIKDARSQPTAQIYSKIKPLRESAMDFITRSKMKAFKASVREQLSF